MYTSYKILFQMALLFFEIYVSIRVTLAESSNLMLTNDLSNCLIRSNIRVSRKT